MSMEINKQNQACGGPESAFNLLYRKCLSEVFFKKSVLKNSQNSKENTCVEVRPICEIPIQVFPCELCKISKYTFFIEHLRPLLLENMPTKSLKKITNIYSVHSEFSLQLWNSLLYISLANLKCTFTLRFHKTFLQEIFVS